MYEINVSRSHCSIREERAGRPALTTKSTDGRFAIRVVSSETVMRRTYHADEDENACARGHQHATYPLRARNPQSAYVQSVAESKPGYCTSTVIAQTCPAQVMKERKYPPPEKSLPPGTEKISFQCICISEKVKSGHRCKSATKCNSEEAQTLIEVELECYSCGRRKVYLVCRACYRAKKIRYCQECRPRSDTIYAKTALSSTENILRLQNAGQYDTQAAGIDKQIQQQSLNVQQVNPPPPSQFYQPPQAQGGLTLVTLSCRSNTELSKSSTNLSGQVFQCGPTYQAPPPAPVYQPSTVRGLQSVTVKRVQSPIVDYPVQPAPLCQPGLVYQAQTVSGYQDPHVSKQSSTLYGKSTEYQAKRDREPKAWYGPPPMVNTNIILGIELKQASSKGENGESDSSTMTSTNSSAAATPQFDSISNQGPSANPGHNVNIDVNASSGLNANWGP